MSRLRTLGPVAAGALLDAVDLATFGPLGLYAGVLLGGIVGWALAPSLGFDERRRWLCAALAGAYCTLPFTAVLPLGTLTGLLVRLHQTREDPGPTAAIDAEYRVEADEDPGEGPPPR